MYLYFHNLGGDVVSYKKDDIKSLSCRFEYDPTLASLPVCEFTAEILDSTHDPDDFKGKDVFIKEKAKYQNVDDEIIASSCYVKEVSRLSPGVIYIRACSVLDKLNDIKMPAYYGYTTAAEVIESIFYDYGGFYVLPYPDITDSIYGNYLYCYFPEQTARERLTMVLQAVGGVCRQWGEVLDEDDNLMYINFDTARDNINDANFINGLSGYEYIEPWFIYDKPVVKRVDAASEYQYTIYSNWSDSYTDGDSRFVMRTEYDLTTGQPVYIYKYARARNYTEYATEDTGEVAVVDNSAMGVYNTLSTIYIHPEYFKRAYFRKYEVELNILDWGVGWVYSHLTRFTPNRLLLFYLDKNTACYGIIKSVQYDIGALNRIKLIVSSDLVPASVYHLKVNYVYKEGNVERLLGSNEYYSPIQSITVKLPTIEAYVVDRLEKFAPPSSSTSYYGLTAETTKTEYYTRSSI